MNHDDRAPRLSRTQAIEQNCRSCVYDPANDGTWRQQTTLCSCHDCFLWHWRPVSASDLPEPLLDAYGLTDAEKLLFRGSTRDFFTKGHDDD
ncbi:MAG: hypothetical protein ACYSUP_15735 [Planctomycetota bacterium]